jgi:C-terminal processing protease CtpA/Prc
LPNGSLLYVTTVGVALGPDDRKLNGIGLTPDVTTSTTTADLEVGHDPQLDAAAQRLRQQLGSR